MKPWLITAIHWLQVVTRVLPLSMLHLSQRHGTENLIWRQDVCWRYVPESGSKSETWDVLIYFIYVKRFKYLSFEVLNDPNSQESLDLPGFHGRRVSERLHLIDLDGDLTSLGHSTSAFEFESFYLFQIQNLVWTSFSFLSKLRQSSWHWASTGWRRWPCRRLGSTAALSAGLELGFCEKSYVTSKPICFYKRSLFIFVHFHSHFGINCGIRMDLWYVLNVQILRWVMCGQSSLTTFARMALQDHNLVIFELRSWWCHELWYRWYSSTFIQYHLTLDLIQVIFHTDELHMDWQYLN